MSTDTTNEKGTPQSRTYTVNDIAAILGIGRASAYKLANSGAFKTIRIGNMIRISRKSFEDWLKAEGLDVMGDPAIDYTETHQVIVSVGYGEGAEIAERLEQNNVIVNYQATPDEEGFTASGALRMGVSEMTRFGFEEKDFDQLASLMADCILRGREIKADVEQLRARHTEMRYCFDDAAINDALEQLAGKLDI